MMRASLAVTFAALLLSAAPAQAQLIGYCRSPDGRCTANLCGAAQDALVRACHDKCGANATAAGWARFANGRMPCPPNTIGENVEGCVKAFNLVGLGKTVKLITHKFFTDIPEARRKDLEEDVEPRKYDGFGYEKIGAPTRTQDCAGMVTDRLWHVGQYWIKADVFFDTIVKNFAAPVDYYGAGPAAVRKGDVVVYLAGAAAGHIAFVSDVAQSRVIIDTKDGQESAYRAALPAPYLITERATADPLVRNYGRPVIYRVDTARIKLTPVSDKNCDS